MGWECGECNAKETSANRIDAVCHHCGKPLCREHRIDIADNAFSRTAMAVPRAAHCYPCRRKWHPGSPALSKTQP